MSAGMALQAVPWIRAGLAFVIALCILGVIWINFVTQANFWNASPFPWSYDLEHPVLDLHYHALEKRFEALGANIYPYGYGSTNVNFIFFLGGTLLAALCTFALRSLPTERTSQSKQFSGFHGAVRKCWLQVKKVIFYPLPPRRFWLWWCDGLDLFDAFFVLTVCAMCIVIAQQMIKSMYEYINGLVSDGTFDDYYEGQSVGLAKLEAIALRTGFIIYPPVMFLFYPVPRSSFLQALFGVDFSYLIRFHRWMGHLTLITTSIHGILYYILWGIQNEFRVKFRWWPQHGISYIAGSLSYIFGLVLWITSLECIRRNYFEVFLRAHIVGFLGFFAFGFVHYDGFLYYAAPALLLYFLDVTFRLAQWMNVSIVTGSLMSENVLALHLKFSPETQLHPNSFIFMNCPDASRVQWHPFTLSYVRNSTHPDQPAHATIYLKPYGRWVQAMVKRIVDKGSAAVKIDGPYGGSLGPLVQGNKPVAVVIAGGIGVTPMLGLLAAMQERFASAEFHGSLTSPTVPGKVIFVWACRHAEEFDMLDEQLLAQSQQEDSWLDIQLYCTGPGQDKGRDSPVKPVPLSDKDSSDGSVSLESCTKYNNEPFPALQRPQLKLASPFFLKPSLLQGYGIGYPLWALVHILSFFGVYYSTLLASAFYSVDAMSMPDGPIYSLYTLMELGMFVVGAMGMPALVIFPFFFFRRRSAARAMKQAELSWKHPDTVLSSVNPQAKMEAGTQLKHTPGRPNIRAILKQVQQEYSSVDEVHVHAAGPPGLVRDVQFNCNDLNAFIGGGTHLLYTVDSFSL